MNSLRASRFLRRNSAEPELPRLASARSSAVSASLQRRIDAGLSYLSQPGTTTTGAHDVALQACARGLPAARPVAPHEVLSGRPTVPTGCAQTCVDRPGS